MDRIVVGIDGSPNSRRALAWAIEEAIVRGAQLVAISAYEPFVTASVPADPEPLRRSATAILDEVVDSADTERLTTPIERLVIQGDPASLLVDASRNATVIVVGTRGHSGFVGAFLGSVSNAVVHHARCPVVVVPDSK